jgi:uncharacterized SAM-binding protein YcdF (DUF218 family)
MRPLSASWLAMTEESSSALPPRRGRLAFRIVLVSTAVMLLAGAVFLFFAGRWLVVEDPLEKAQAIAVLSGNMPLRAVEAAKLYREGYAPEIWLTRSTEPGGTLEAMGIQYVGEEFYNLRVLMHEGVPADAIRVLEPPIVNTSDEVNAISVALVEEKGSTVIIVTTKAHTRRVRTLWNRLAADSGRMIVRAASDDPFQTARWWSNTRDALDVVRELLGLLNAWTGMRVRPAK